MSLAESLSWRRRLADVDGEVNNAEVRVGLMGSEEGPGMVMDRGESRDGMAERDVGLMVRRGKAGRGVDMKKGEEGRAGVVARTYIRVEGIKKGRGPSLRAPAR